MFRVGLAVSLLLVTVPSVKDGRVPVDEGIAYLEVVHRNYRLREGR